MSDLKTFRIKSPSGWRTWQAEDKAHAIEQHRNAFAQDNTERILKVRELPRKKPSEQGKPKHPGTGRTRAKRTEARKRGSL